MVKTRDTSWVAPTPSSYSDATTLAKHSFDVAKISLAWVFKVGVAICHVLRGCGLLGKLRKCSRLEHVL